MLGTKLTIDANEETSLTAASPATILDTEIDNDEKLRVFVDGIGSNARNAFVWLIGTRVVANIGDTVPGIPVNFTATPGNTQVVLDWDAPSSNGGQAITDYVVQFKLTSEPTTWTTFTDGVSATAGPVTVTGLVNGNSYDFRVAAVNSIGQGSFTTTAVATPRTVPSQVGTVTPTAGNAQVALAWSAPANGGSAITDYEVEQSLNGSTGWGTAAGGSVTATTGQTVTGLTNGTQYFYRVRAVNAAGAGAWSNVINSTPAASGLANGSHNLNPTTNSAHILSASTDDPTPAWNASAGSSQTVGGNTSIQVGQNVTYGVFDFYDVWEGFLEFNTQTAGGTITAATLTINVSANDSAADFIVEAYLVDYGSTIEGSDFVPRTSITGTLLASRDTAAFTTGNVALTANGSALVDAMNEAGPTRIMLVSSRHRIGGGGNIPSGPQHITINRASTVLAITVS
jgi:hypothetical protein